MKEAEPRAEPGSNDERRAEGANVLRLGAYAVIVVAGLKAAGSIIVPVLLAAVLSVMCVPPARRLQGWGIPRSLSILLVGVAVVLVVFVLSAVVGDSVARFSASVPAYEKRLGDILESGRAWLDGLGLDVPEGHFSNVIDTNDILKLTADTMQSLLGVLSSVFVVLFLVLFMLSEAQHLPDKLRRAGGRPDADLTGYAQVANRIYEYVHLKGVLSLITGILVAILTAVAGVDFPLLWGLLAFLFNFIPTIGSILAAIPVLLLSLIQQDVGTTLLVAAGYVAINTVIGNLIEPRVMGRRLGLSPLVVILSLIFWSWVWGPVGMLLSVPLTMVVKMLLEHSEELRFVAVLLGPSQGNGTATKTGTA